MQETLPAVDDSKGQLLSGNSLVPSEERPTPSPGEWKYFPDDLMRIVFSKMNPTAQQRSRLVSKNWCAVMDELLKKASIWSLNYNLRAKPQIAKGLLCKAKCLPAFCLFLLLSSAVSIWKFAAIV